jgi:hypothetical protein
MKRLRDADARRERTSKAGATKDAAIYRNPMTAARFVDMLKARKAVSK